MAGMIPPQAKKVFRGILFDIYQWEQQLYDGTSRTFELATSTPAAHIIATKDGKVLINKESQPSSGSYLALPGGLINRDEDPMVGAQREFTEETGFSTDIKGLFYSEQGTSKVEHAINIYYGDIVGDQIEKKLGSGEKIQQLWFSFDDFLRLAFNKEFRMSAGLRLYNRRGFL